VSQPLKYSWLLFDADETLFDFPKSEARALQSTLEQAGLPFTPAFASLFSRCNEQVWHEMARGEITWAELRVKRFHLFFEETRLNGDAHTVSPLFLQHLALGADLIDGAEEVIHALKENHRLALVTNGMKQVQRPRLEASSIRDCFEKVFVSDEIGADKPSRAYLDAVYTEIGQPPKETVLIIGDNLNTDMQGGLDYGIHTCWYNPRGKIPTLPVRHVITNLKELLPLLQ
jgi:2-haloacid dehalogenase